MFTKGITSGLASGLAGGKGGSSLKDHETKEEKTRNGVSGIQTGAITTKPGSSAYGGPSIPTSQRSGGTNNRLAHIRANYPRPEMFIKNGKLVLKSKN